MLTGNHPQFSVWGLTLMHGILIGGRRARLGCQRHRRDASGAHGRREAELGEKGPRAEEHHGLQAASRKQEETRSRIPQSFQREHSLADTLVLDLCPPELSGSTFVLFGDVHVVGTRCDGHGTLCARASPLHDASVLPQVSVTSCIPKSRPAKI